MGTEVHQPTQPALAHEGRMQFLSGISQVEEGQDYQGSQLEFVEA